MTQSKAQNIEETKANLPIPEQPPVASDFNSADARTVNVGAGRSEAEANIGTNEHSKSGIRGPASTNDADLSNVGREAVEGQRPKDASY